MIFVFLFSNKKKLKTQYEIWMYTHQTYKSLWIHFCCLITLSFDYSLKRKCYLVKLTLIIFNNVFLKVVYFLAYQNQGIMHPDETFIPLKSGTLTTLNELWNNSIFIASEKTRKPILGEKDHFILILFKFIKSIRFITSKGSDAGEAWSPFQ